jgi:hypothetical protein
VKPTVHVVKRPELVQRVGDDQVVKTLFEQDLGQRYLVLRDGLPAPEVDVLAVPLMPVPEGEGSDTGMDRAPRQDGG